MNNYKNEKWTAVRNADNSFHIAPESAFKNGVRWFADKVCDGLDEQTAKHIVKLQNKNLKK